MTDGRAQSRAATPYSAAVLEAAKAPGLALVPRDVGGEVERYRQGVGWGLLLCSAVRVERACIVAGGCSPQQSTGPADVQSVLVVRPSTRWAVMVGGLGGVEG